MITKYEKANAGKLLAAVLVLAMVFAGAAVMIGDSDVDAASSDTTYLSGQVTATQNYGDGTNVVVNGDLTIPAGMAMVISGTGKLTIESGATLTIAAGGQLILQQTNSGAKNPTVIVNGNIVAQGTAPNDYNSTSISYFGAIINNTTYSATDKTGLTVNGTITLEKGAEFMTTTETKDTLPNDSLVTGNNSVNGDVFVGEAGSINVTKRTSSISTISGQDITLNEGSTFDLNGYATNVTISATGNATYRTMASVSITNTDPTEDDRDASDLTFTVTSQSTPAYLTCNDSKTQVTLRQYIINIDGNVSNNDKLTIGAGTCYAPAGTTNYVGTFYDTKKVEIANNEIQPMTSVTGTLTFDAGTSLEISNRAKLMVSGEVTLKTSGSGDNIAGADFNLGGSLYVTGTFSTTVIGKDTYNFTVSQSDSSTYGQDVMTVDGGMISFNTTHTNMSISNLSGLHLRGSVYQDITTDSSVVYICDFEDAIAGSAQTEDMEVYVFAYGANNRTTSEYAVNNGACVVDSDITIPDDMTVTIYNALVVSEGATLTVSEDADLILSSGKKIFVEGKIVDYSGCMVDCESEAGFIYEVKKTTETETTEYVTYTTLPIAISEAQPGEEIQLNGTVDITENLTIPTDVTVVTDESSNLTNSVALNVQGATLTVDGVLDITAGTVTLTAPADDAEDVGQIVVNNIIKNATAGATGTFKDGSNGDATIPGAYFSGQIGDDAPGTNYVASAAVAGANSTTTSTINIYGKLSMGDVTFTQGDNALSITVYGEVSAGTVTLAGNDVSFAITGTNASFTGAVASDVTAGTAAVQFSKASGATVSTDNTDNGETVTTFLVLDGIVKGSATISSGTVNAGAGLTMSAYDATNKVKSIITIASGATLSINENEKLTVANGTADNEAYATLVIEGALVYNDGEFTNSGLIDVAGSMDVNSDLTLGGTVNITGTVTVLEGENAATLTISKAYVGDGEGATGTITGAIALNGFIVAYPQADVSGAAIDEQVDGTSTANVTQFYINGNLYMTSYANSTTKFSDIMTDNVELVGYKPVQNWYPTEEMTGTALSGDETMDEVPAAYAKAEPRTVDVQVSVGQGMSVYIDNVRYSNGQTAENLAVGTHTVSVQVNPGYTGTTSILFDGQAVTGDSFTITAEMAGTSNTVPTVVLSVTGEISVDTGSSTSDDGMGIVEILLVILVVVVVILAIIVVLRMMRS